MYELNVIPENYQLIVNNWEPDLTVFNYNLLFIV